MTSTATAAHTTSIYGQRYQGEGAYGVRCSCGHDSGRTLAYHADAKQYATAHVAQAAASK